MKKIGLIALTIVLSLGLLGAGFAYWDETLEIGENPVNTGELNVQFSDRFAKGIPPYAHLLDADGNEMYGQYPPMTGDTLTVHLTNMYPGATYGFYSLGAKNLGSIPAKIQSVSIDPATFSDPGTIAPYVQWKTCWSGFGSITRADGSGVSIPNIPNGLQNWTPIVDVPGKMYSTLQPYVLYPGDRLGFDTDEPEEPCFDIRFSPNAPNSAEGYTISFDIVFTWTQFNDPVSP